MIKFTRITECTEETYAVLMSDRGVKCVGFVEYCPVEGAFFTLVEFEGESIMGHHESCEDAFTSVRNIYK